MSFLNSLCTDPGCRGWGRCTHLGPRGEHCYFYVEKALCDILGKDWKPELTLDSLLAEVRDRLQTLKPPGPLTPYGKALKEAEQSLTLNSIYGEEKEPETP